MGNITLIPPNHPIYSHFTKLKGNKRSKSCIIIDTKKQVRLNLGGEVKGKTKSKKIEDHHHLVWKKSEIMESGLRLQIEKLEAKLKPYRRDNEESRNTNTNSEVIIKIHEMQKELKEQKKFDQKNHIEKLSAQIEKLKSENDFNQRLKNQDIKKKINNYEAKIKQIKFLQQQK